MGACCGGMGTGEQKSLPVSQKANNVDESDKCVNGLKGDAIETPADTAEQSSPEHEAHANANHTEDHMQPSTVSTDQVELKITEPDRPEPDVAAPAVSPVPEKLDVCPEHPPAPDTQPTEVPVVSENDDFARQKNESSVTEVTTTTTTTMHVEHTQISSSAETTEVRTRTIVEETLTSTDATSKDEEQQKVGDVELVKLGDDVASAPIEVPPVTAEVDFSPALAETTAGTEDHQKQADVIVEAPASEVVQAASAVDQQEPAVVPSAEQIEHVSVPESVAPSQELDTQHQDEQLPTATTPEVNDAPTVTAYVEPGTVDEARHEETSVASGEQPEQQQHLPAAANDLAATSEQQTGNADVEAPSVAVEALVDTDVSSHAMTIAHEEPSPASEVAVQPKTVEETNTESIPASEAAGPVVDDSASKPEEAVSTTQDALGDVYPEELPPPLTPEKEDAPGAAAYHEEDRQAPVTDGYVELTTETSSEQTDQYAINGSIDNVEEPTSKPNTEAADQAADVPVAGEP